MHVHKDETVIMNQTQPNILWLGQVRDPTSCLMRPIIEVEGARELHETLVVEGEECSRAAWSQRRDVHPKPT